MGHQLPLQGVQDQAVVEAAQEGVDRVVSADRTGDQRW